MRIRLFIGLLVASFILASAAHAQWVDKRLRKGGFGIKAGMVSQTTLAIEGRRFPSQFAMSGGIFFEFPLSDMLMLSLSGDLHNFVVDGLKDNEPFFDVSIGPKYLAVVESVNIALKPGFAIGLGYLGPMGTKFTGLGMQRDRIARTSYMTWRVSSEILFLTHQQHAYLAEAALFGTALGRNSDVEVTTNPTFLFRVGIMY